MSRNGFTGRADDVSRNGFSARNGWAGRSWSLLAGASTILGRDIDSPLPPCRALNDRLRDRLRGVAGSSGGGGCPERGGALGAKGGSRSTSSPAAETAAASRGCTGRSSTGRSSTGRSIASLRLCGGPACMHASPSGLALICGVERPACMHESPPSGLAPAGTSTVASLR